MNLTLDESCLEELRRVARVENRTLSELVNELLVKGLRRRKDRRKNWELDLPSFSMGRPLGNLDDRNAIESLFESATRDRKPA